VTTILPVVGGGLAGSCSPHTGDAIHADGDYIGITVNKAARIASASAPGKIMLSSVTAEMAAGRGYSLGETRTVDLKGLAGTHRLTQLVGRHFKQPSV
jgi:class 3 adenylate cyclase